MYCIVGKFGEFSELSFNAKLRETIQISSCKQ